MSQIYYKVLTEFTAWSTNFPTGSVHAHADFDFFSKHDEDGSTLKNRIRNGFLEMITEDEALEVMEQQEAASAPEPVTPPVTPSGSDTTQSSETGNTEPPAGAGAGEGGAPGTENPQ